MTVPKPLFLAFLATLSIVAALACEVASATPDNWIEVARFTHRGTTDFFNCSHVEWRIQWSYVPDPPAANYTVFCVTTYPQGEAEYYIDQISMLGDNVTSGISYIHNKTGTFYCLITQSYTMSFTVIIEQDLDSIPEFPTFLALPLFMTAALLAVIAHRRKRSVKATSAWL